MIDDFFIQGINGRQTYVILKPKNVIYKVEGTFACIPFNKVSKFSSRKYTRIKPC